MPILSKSGLAAAAFTVVAFALPAQAGEWERERDTNGLYKEPVCEIGYRVKSLLVNIARQQPTGIKASNDKWDMEIYNNPETNSWTLVGKSKAPEAAHSSKLCRLASGLQTPYVQEKWYALDFAKQPKVAVVPVPAITN